MKGADRLSLTTRLFARTLTASSSNSSVTQRNESGTANFRHLIVRSTISLARVTSLNNRWASHQHRRLNHTGPSPGSPLQTYRISNKRSFPRSLSRCSLHRSQLSLWNRRHSRSYPLPKRFSRRRCPTQGSPKKDPFKKASKNEHQAALRNTSQPHRLLQPRRTTNPHGKCRRRNFLFRRSTKWTSGSLVWGGTQTPQTGRNPIPLSLPSQQPNFRSQN